jgi:hypothetical protein
MDAGSVHKALAKLNLEFSKSLEIAFAILPPAMTAFRP